MAYSQGTLGGWTTQESLLAAYNEDNVLNSVSLFVGERLLAAGYLLYWHAIDAVQTPDAWYPEYSTRAQSYLAQPAFASRLAGGMGLLTFHSRASAKVAYPVRPTSDGTIAAGNELPVPVLGVEVGPMITGSRLEMGSHLKWRGRHLAIYGYARDEREQGALRDALGIWFDADTVVDVRDHTSGSLALVGSVEVTLPSTDSMSYPLGGDATRHELILNARLRYLA